MAGPEEGFVSLKRRLYRDRGLDCDQFKESFLKRRIAVRLRATGSQDYREYSRLLRREPEEYHLLLDELTINLTRFFRDPDVYHEIEASVVGEILGYRRESGRLAIRIWSAGCASGEEAYSLAILFHHCLRRAPGDWDLSVIGTDIHERSLGTAREAVYEDPTLIGGLRRGRYFVEEEGRFRVKDEIRDLVRFQQKDIFHMKHKNFFDLVVCRNVLIYFSREVQEDMLGVLAGATRNGGYLVLGKAENPGAAGQMDLYPLFPKERIYRKQRGVVGDPA